MSAFEDALNRYSGDLQDGECLTDLDPDAAWMLVERSAITGTYWLTTHDTQKAAGEYHDDQEYPDDWVPEELIDLRTGEKWQRVTCWRAVATAQRTAT